VEVLSEATLERSVDGPSEEDMVVSDDGKDDNRRTEDNKKGGKELTESGACL